MSRSNVMPSFSMTRRDAVLAREREGDDRLQAAGVGEVAGRRGELGRVALAPVVGVDDPGELDLEHALDERHVGADAPDELVGRAFEGVPGAEVVGLPVGAVLADQGRGLLARHRAAHGLRHARQGHDRRELVEVLESGKAADQARRLDDAQRATHWPPSRPSTTSRSRLPSIARKTASSASVPGRSTTWTRWSCSGSRPSKRLT